MPNVKRARGQLLKAGYVPVHQDDGYERWVSVTSGCAPVSFVIDPNGTTTSHFKVEGEVPDRPEFDERSSFCTPVLKWAIFVSKSRSPGH